MDNTEEFLKGLNFSAIDVRRRRLGATASELCRLAGVGPATYTRWRRGVGVEPSEACLVRLSDALDELEKCYRAAFNERRQTLKRGLGLVA